LIASEVTNADNPENQRLRGGIVFIAALGVGWFAIDFLVDRGAYIGHFHQSWISHFSAPMSSEYGSPSDHRFDWTILLKNWDTAVPALAGVVFLLSEVRRMPRQTVGSSTIQRLEITATVPLAWLLIALGYFSLHHPWWNYYYLHITLPLCWCAAFGAAQSGILLYRRFEIGTAHTASRRNRIKSTRSTLLHFTLLAPLILILLLAAAWQTGRVYLQAKAIRNSPQTYYDLVLPEIQQYKPFTQWIYSDEPIYSFHSGIPVPPPLAVLSLKRLWSGDMTNARIAQEVRSYKPGLILLRNDTRALPFQDFMDREYQLVYQDDRHRLYAARAISQKPFE
jgi:hypothetical protein